MVRVTLDSRLESSLVGVDEAEVCNAEGRTLGHFLSEAAYMRMICDLANAQVTDDELERALQQPGGRSLAEIMADLEGR